MRAMQTPFQSKLADRELNKRNEVVTILPECSTAEVLRLLGCSNGKRVSSRIKNKMRFWKNELNKLIRPRILYSVKNVANVSKTGVHLMDGISFRSHKLSRAFSHCHEALLFTATIGPGFDETVKDLAAKNRMSEACILDSLGSVAVENMVQQFHARYDAHLNLRGKSATLPFSPGYCDWNISEQKKIFSLMDAERIGVSINESALMEPRKSISGVVGLQNSVTSSGKPYNPCMHCTKVDCSYKRAV